MYVWCASCTTLGIYNGRRAADSIQGTDMQGMQSASRREHSAWQVPVNNRCKAAAAPHLWKMWTSRRPDLGPCAAEGYTYASSALPSRMSDMGAAGSRKAWSARCAFRSTSSSCAGGFHARRQARQRRQRLQHVGDGA